MLRCRCVDEGGELCGVHDFAGNVVELRGGKGVDLCESLFEGYDVTGVEVVFCHAECGVLEVVCSYSELPLELAFGSSDGAGREGRIDESVERAVDESEAAADIRVVAAEVDAPDSGVGIGIDVGFHGVDQSGALAQGKAESGIHGRSSEEVGEEEDAYVAGVGEGKGAGAEHDVCLMGVLVRDGKRAESCWAFRAQG